MRTEIKRGSAEHSIFLEGVHAGAEIIEREIHLELDGLIPEEHLTKGGFVALARASVSNVRLFQDIRKHVLTAVTHPTDFQPLTPSLVNGIWLNLVKDQEQRNGKVSVKTAVLLYLWNHGMEDANPTMTKEELLIALDKRNRTGATEIPMFSYIPAEQYDDPPYEFLKAQVLLMNSQQLMDKVARKADKTSVGCPFKDLDRRQQELYAIKLMEIESNK